LLRVSSKLFKGLSDTASPQDLIAEAKHRWSKPGELASSGRHLLVAWGVQDPGNIGTMVRSSAAFEMGGVIFGADSADPFSSKAVRASAGTVLYQPLARAKILSRLVKDLREAGYETHWTGVRAKTSLRGISRRRLHAVFIGSEGRGFSEKERGVIGPGVRIETSRRVDSLNAGVAGSIVAYELAAQSGQICS
jgi:TrmH family RNA methyltransferase